MLDGRVVVEMVPRQIGEGAGRDPHAVEPVLIKAVRRRFDRQMRDPLTGKVGQRAMQSDRVRRRQRAIDLTLRRDHADRADTRCLITESGPNLAGEGGDRGLAAGAGHSRDHGRLPAEKPRGGESERAARVIDGDKDRPIRQRRGILFTDNRGSAGRRSLGGERRPIGLAAGQRDEHIATPDHPTVRRDAARFD